MFWFRKANLQTQINTTPRLIQVVTRTTTEINRLPMPIAVEVKAVVHVPRG